MSFRLKTILGAATIQLIFLTVMNLFSVQHLTHTNLEQLSFRAEALAGLIAQSAQDYVLLYDTSALQSLVNHQLKSNETVYISISDNVNTLAKGGPLPDIAPVFNSIELNAEDGIMDAEATIRIGDVGYGKVRLGLSTQHTYDQIAEATEELIYSEVLSELVFLVFFSWLLGSFVTRGLQRLEDASNAIRENGPGYQIDNAKRDELSPVIDAFNVMSKSLAESATNANQLTEAFRKLALKAAKDEALSKVTLTACLDGILHLDEQGFITEFSEQAALIFGWPRYEIIGFSANDTLFPKELRQHYSEDLQRFFNHHEGDVFNKLIELQARHREGHDLIVELSIAETRVQSERSFILFIRDITERKEQTEQLEQARHTADEANHAKSRFLATMSHEIRSPLNAVINMNELLLESELREEQKDLARVAREGGMTLLSLINDILDFSRIESGKLEFHPRVTQLKTTVQSIAELHAGIACRNGIALQTIISPAFDREVMIDDIRLRQILNNLISNALKFTSEGGVIVRLSPADPGYFELSVTDSGMGIAPKDQQTIFDEFRQLEDSDSRRFGGSGLGLSISKKLVEGMHGRIQVSSTVGQGSRFSVFLPFEPVTDVAAQQPSVAAQDYFTDAVFINLDNPVMAQAIEELCALWHIKAYNMRLSVIDHDENAQHPVMLVDYDADAKRRPNYRIGAHRLLPDVQWRYLPITSVQTEKVDYSPQKTGFFGFLRAPIRIETFLRFVTREDPHEQIETLEHETTQEFLKCNARILLVDDSHSNLAVAQALMANLGCNIETAEDGMQAVELAAKNNYDIIFMDLAMPRMDGLEATSRIRNQAGPNQTTPIIALTANAFAEDRERCLSMGMTDYLSKPIQRKQLFETLLRYSPSPILQSKKDSKAAAKRSSTGTQPRDSQANTHSEKQLSDTSMPAPAHTITSTPAQPTIPIIDTKVLKQIEIDTSPAAVPALLEIYLGEVPTRVQAINDLFEQQSYKDLEREAHSLKSSSASFGAPNLAEVAKVIEFAAREQNGAQIEPQLAQLGSLAEATLKALQDYVESL